LVARAWDDEALVQSRESEVAGAGSEEWESAGDLLEVIAEETILLAFLTDNACDTSDEREVSI
jgi:hypothetical protein